jgi:hypothetical protein
MGSAPKQTPVQSRLVIFLRWCDSETNAWTAVAQTRLSFWQGKRHTTSKNTTREEPDKRVQKEHADEKDDEREPDGNILVFSAERGALCQTSLTTGGLAKHAGAGAAQDYGLSMREDGGDGEATWALDIHEVGVGRLHQTLELMLFGLKLGGGV